MARGGKPWWYMNRPRVGPPLEPSRRHPRRARPIIRCQNCRDLIVWLARAEDKFRLVPIDAADDTGKLLWDGNPYYVPGHDRYHYCGDHTLVKIEDARKRHTKKIEAKAASEDQTNIDNWFKE